MRDVNNKLNALQEKHQYPEQQHTTSIAQKKERPVANLNIISAIKTGKVIGYADICILGIPKSVFKSLQIALKGAAYTPYASGVDVAVVDKFYYTKKHQEADEAGIPCITFHQVVTQLVTSKDPEVKRFLEGEGKVIMDKVTAFLAPPSTPKPKKGSDKKKPVKKGVITRFRKKEKAENEKSN